MIRLLNGGFTRLKKSKIFWFLIITSIIMALFMIFCRYNDMKRFGETIDVSVLILNYSTIVGIVIAIFTSLFLGVEYSSGAIRNKITIGHKRTDIYLSNLIIITVTSFFSYFLWIITIVLIGFPLFGVVTMPLSELLRFLGCIILTIVAYSSVFTLLAMAISNRTITAVTSLLLVFSLMVGAGYCLSVLSETEYIQTASLVNGVMEFEEIPNPKYPSEKERKVYQTLLDINPAGQSFEIVGKFAPNLKMLPIYSLGIIILSTLGGIYVFDKKELK